MTTNYTLTDDELKNIIIVGITGYKGHGKDTIGNYLIEKYNFIRLAYGDPIKDICRTVFSFTDEQLYSYEGKERVDEFWKHTPRELFQFIGTQLFRKRLPELCKNLSEDIWVNVLYKKIIDKYRENPEKNTRFVITDVRFPNEFDLIKRLGGTTLRVIRQSDNKTCNSNNNEEKETLLDKNKNKKIIGKQTKRYSEKFVEIVKHIKHMYLSFVSNISSKLRKREKVHASEFYIDKFIVDHDISNSSDVNTLLNKIDDIFEDKYCVASTI